MKLSELKMMMEVYENGPSVEELRDKFEEAKHMLDIVKRGAFLEGDVKTTIETKQIISLGGSIERHRSGNDVRDDVVLKDGDPAIAEILKIIVKKYEGELKDRLKEIKDAGIELEEEK